MLTAQTKSPIANTAYLMAEVAKRVERGMQLRKLGYGFAWSPFGPSTYGVLSPKRVSYIVTLNVEIGAMHCTCEDFAYNGLGTCKHCCAVLAEKAQIEADGLALTRSMYKVLGKQFVSGYVRNGKKVAPYVRSQRLSYRVPDAVVEAQCDEYDERHGWAA
jgi:hypothetical protein